MKVSGRQRSCLIILIGALCLSYMAFASQAPPAPAAPAGSVARVLGTVTAVDGNTVTVKSDAGVVQKVVVQDATRMLQTAPGQTTLSGATAIHVSDLEVGDRVSVRGTLTGDGSGDGASVAAISLIAMKQADLQKKQEADREDWQKRGIGGVVKAVDPATSTVTVTVGSGATAKPLAVHAGKTTIIRRYASDSAKLADAKAATLDQVKAGDQLQARGTRSDDGSELAAEEIVVGNFRNLAGTITAVDASAGTISFTDLATKKPYVIHCTADSQMRKLPPMMAQVLAARLKGGAAAGSTASGSPRPSSPGAGPGTGPAAGSGAGYGSSYGSGTGAGASGGPGGGTHSGGRSADPQQILSRAPVIQLSDLQKGDAVMVVATEGTAPGTTAGSSTAVTLIAGVEPMLQASASGSQGLLSSSWSLGSGASGGDAGQ